MTYEDGLIFDQQYHSNTATRILQKYIAPYTTTFNGQSFLTWSAKQGFAISESGHPLEEAHIAAADYIFKVFDKQNIIDR